MSIFKIGDSVCCIDETNLGSPDVINRPVKDGKYTVRHTTFSYVTPSITLVEIVNQPIIANFYGSVIETSWPETCFELIELTETKHFGPAVFDFVNISKRVKLPL